MDKKKIYRSIIFLAIGILLFWFVFRDTNLDVLKQEFHQITWSWVWLSVILNIFSQLLRALRWNLLFEPLKFTPRLHNLFFSVLILGFTNQVIPRGGEVARLGIVNRYEKVPFAQLFGIALVERLTDLLILLLIFFALLIWQFQRITTLINLPQISLPSPNFTNILLISGISIIVVVGIYFLIKKLNLFKKLRERLRKIRNEISEGFTSLYYIRKKALYFTYSFLIYGVWLLMSYVLFYAYPPTSDLGFEAAAFTFGLATLAFLVPVQAGIGAWHFVVIHCLFLFGIEQEAGKLFSLIAHASTNLVYLPLGAVAFALLPIFNQRASQKK